MNELKIEILISAMNYCERVVNVLPGVIDNYRIGREDLTIQPVLDFVEGIEWLLSCFQLTESLLQEYDIQISVQELMDLNVQVVGAVENKDYVLVADLLEYEIVGLFETWTQKLRILETPRS